MLSRFALIVLVVALPMAAAETIAPTLAAPDAPSTTSGLPALPTAEPPQGGTIPSIDEDALTFQGTPGEPLLIVIRGPEGAPLFHYAVDEQGRARLDVAGENILADATLVRVDGDPLGDAFTLTLRDLEGEEHEVKVDRPALEAAALLPEDAPLPEGALSAAPVEVLRPLAWPGSPSESYLLYVEDAARNHLAAGSLDGSPYLQRGGQHLAVVQVPLAEMQWDNVLLRVNKAGSSLSENFTFTRVRDTDSAAIFHARYMVDGIGASDGDTVELRVVFERRLTPLVSERLPEPTVYQARVDGLAPTARMQAPATSDDLHVALTWSGTDAHSGIGGYNVQYRLAGASTWTSWLAPTTAPGATFSGAWGQTYEFRTFALDRVGIPSATPATASTRFIAQSEAASGADEVNDAPSARLVSPRAGQVLAGTVSVAWEAADPDGTPVTSRLQLSDDDGVTWRTLFAGQGTAFTWNTGSEADGSGYRLRLTVTDGTLSEGDTLSGLSIQNVAAPPELPTPAPDVTAPGGPAAPPGPASQPAPTPGAEPQATEGGSTDDGTDGATAAEGGKGTPMPPVALVALAIGAAALLSARRRRQ